MRVSSPSRTGNASAASACSAAARSAARCGSDRSSRSSGWSSSQSWARTTAIGRPTRPATCSLPSPANVSTVHSVVSIARSAAVSADSADGAGPSRSFTSAATQPGRQPAERQLARRRGRAADRRPAGPAGRARSPTPPGRRSGSCEQLADRVARPVEDLQRLVEVVGQQEAGDRVDGARRVDLVDRGPRRARLRRRRRPGGTSTAPAAGAGAGGAGWRARRRSRCGPAPRPSRPRAGRACARTRRAASPSSPGCVPAGEQQRRAAGAGGTKSPVVGAGALEAVVGASTPSSCEPDAVERGGHQVELLDRARRARPAPSRRRRAPRRRRRSPSPARPRRRGSPRTAAASVRAAPVVSSDAAGVPCVVGRGDGARRTGSRSTASSVPARASCRCRSSSASHSSQSGTHGCDHAVTPIGDGSAPDEQRVAEQLVGEVGLLEPPGRSSPASAWVDPS